MSRLAKIGAASLLGVLVLGVILPMVSKLRQGPSQLFIHVDSLPWQTVIVESANLPTPIRFEQRPGELKVSPISHGIYRIGIQFTDGEAIWSEFFHADVGVRRRVDVFVTILPGGYHFRQTANQSNKLFDGDVRPENATKQKPFRLDRI